MTFTRTHLFVSALVLMIGIAAVPAGAGVILNTLESFGEPDPGWSGNLNGLFSGSGGNTESITFETGGRLQWQGDKQRVRLQVSGSYKENQGEETGRNVVAHLRHHRHLTERWAVVSFAQIQHNPFQHLNSRWLFGVGPRWDLARDDKGMLALGATPMLEIERIEGTNGHMARGRLSTFLHAARRLSDNTKLDAVAFWQPLFSDVTKSRMVGNLTLSVQVSGSIELKAGGAVEHNGHPPVGVEKTDWSTFTGLEFGF